MNTGNNPLISNHRIAHYRIVRKLGQGGMSIVYEGFDERLKRPVALKVLHPFLAEAPEYRSRFFREAEAVARLTHPNIVQIFDVSSAEQTNEQLYIVTELLLGATLKELEKKINFFEMPELSAMIIWQIALAIDHAHQRGIIHRDIKPENIMIGADGQIKLMDFGIASVGNEESITQSGTILGSLAHLSPEVIKGQKATVESDIFSLTTVFYRMLTREPPFVGDSPHALLKAIVDEPHKKAQYASPFISDELADVVEKGMQKDPKNRFTSAQAMAEAIEAALLTAGISIDVREMQAVLKKPENSEHFKSIITDQIKRQVEVYRAAKNEAGALALMCRLDATPTDALKTAPLKTTKKKKVIWLSAVSTILVLGATAVFFMNEGDVSPPQEPIAMTETVRVITEDAAPKEDSLEPMPVEDVKVVEEEKFIEEVKEKTETKPPAHARFQDIQFVIWPFATVSVDSKIVARDQKSVKVSLTEGVHRILFTHTYAATVEKIIKVTEIHEPFEVHVALVKSKPALLVVKSEIDGDIAIDGDFRGTISKSARQPIVIPMPDRTHALTKEIFISKKGFEPIIMDIEFVAGQVNEVEVKLVPEDKGETTTLDEHVKTGAKRLY